MILRSMKNEHKKVLTKEELLNWIKSDYTRSVNKEFGAILITAGAGDIDNLVDPISNELKKI